MNLLYPAMLAGLAALAVPVALHLIARHRFPVLDFPSIRLLQADLKTNVFAPRLVDVGQLLLRLLVLLLLVAAMSRLVGPAWLGGPAARNVVVVLDDSASMRSTVDAGGGRKTSLWDRAKDEARTLLSGIAAPSRCGLVAAGGERLVLADFSPHPDAALAALDAATVGDGSGAGLVAAVAEAAEMVRGRREAGAQIVVLTDLRSTAFEARGARDLERIASVRDEMGDRLQITFVDLAGPQANNLAITAAEIRGGEVKMGDDAHVVARIRNLGREEQSAKVRLSVGDRDEPLVKEIVVAPGADAVVDLTTRANRATRTFARMRLQNPDALAFDDQFDLPLDVVDHRRVLVVRGGSGDAPRSSPSALERLSGGRPDDATAPDEPTVDGATILRYALNPGRELGLAHGTGINATLVAPDALAGQPLSKYELVILYDVGRLPEPALADLETFVRQGKGLLIVCSGACSPVEFNRSLAAAAPKRSALAPAELGNEETFKSALALETSDRGHPLLTPFGDPLQGDLSVLRFNVVRRVRARAEDATVALALVGGMPLAIERPLGQGRVMMLTCGVELDRCNLARARAFPKLLWRLVDYLGGSLREVRPDVLIASQPAVLDVSEPTFALATELELVAVPAPHPTETPTNGSATAPEVAPRDGSGAPRSWRLPVGENRTVLVAGVPAGRYLLQKPRRPEDGAVAGGSSRGVTVRSDPRESDLARIDGDGLSALLGDGVRVAAARVPDDLQPPGGELWTPLVVLLLIAYAAEAAFGWLQNARREKRRLA